MMRGDGLGDHSAHRDADEVRVAVPERVQQTDGVAGHVAQVVLAFVAAAAQDRQRSRPRKARMGGPADVAIVEPDCPVSALGEVGGDLVRPGVLLLSQPGDQHDRWRRLVTERVVAQLDSATHVDDYFVRHADTSVAASGTELSVSGARR